MTRYGQEVETTYLDNNMSTVDVIHNIKDFDVKTTFKRYTIRIRVNNKKDETTQFLMFSDMIDEKRRLGILLVRDNDPNTRPSFIIEYPRTNQDGSYFVIRTHTELMV